LPAAEWVLRLFISADARNYRGLALNATPTGWPNFCQATEQKNDPAKLHLLIQVIDSKNWSRLNVDVKGEAYEGPLNAVAGKVDSGQST
jgi:hypothetical protein